LVSRFYSGKDFLILENRCLRNASPTVAYHIDRLLRFFGEFELLECPATQSSRSIAPNFTKPAQEPKITAIFKYVRLMNDHFLKQREGRSVCSAVQAGAIAKR
jgi:hypothetical protein